MKQCIENKIKNENIQWDKREKERAKNQIKWNVKKKIAWMDIDCFMTEKKKTPLLLENNTILKMEKKK